MRTPLLTALAFSLAGCGALTGGGGSGLGDEAGKATAQIASPGGASTGVTGTVTFTELDGGVYLSYEITGLAPGDHGFHVHEGASCAAADTDGDGTAEPGGAAGGHFNPGSDPHGAPSADEDAKHAGDLGNITADADGLAVGGREASALSFEGATDLVGRAVIVHSGADDFVSQPGGDSGARVGCGVITAGAR